MRRRHHSFEGRLVKEMGDGLLVEFASVVDAVECAASIQQGMARREADVPADRRIELRMGVNLGDVMIEGDDIHGAGVNIAARLEALAEPGGVCVSRTVVEHVKDKLDLKFAALGPQKVKNIAEPVEALRVRLDEAPGAAPVLDGNCGANALRAIIVGNRAEPSGECRQNQLQTGRTGMTSIIKSECCEFHVSTLNSADAYCYVCGRVHEHDHLDLRDLRMTLLGRVTKRHNLKGISKNDATDVKLGRPRGSRGSRAGLASGFSVFSDCPAGLFPSLRGLQAEFYPDDHHGAAGNARL